MILQINPKHPQPRRIEKVAEVLRSDGVIVYPTDTVYGLGCDIRSKKALEKVRRIKKMDNKRHLTFVFADLKQISHYAQVTDYAAQSAILHEDSKFLFHACSRYALSGAVSIR